MELTEAQMDRMWDAATSGEPIPDFLAEARARKERLERLRRWATGESPMPADVAREFWREENPPPYAESPISTRLHWWLDDELRRLFHKTDEGPSRGLRRIVGEWYVRERWPAIEFRETPVGRVAAVVDGPEVWVIELAWRTEVRDWLRDPETIREFARRFEIPETTLDDALDYAELFHLEVEATIEAAVQRGFARTTPTAQR